MLTAVGGWNEDSTSQEVWGEGGPVPHDFRMKLLLESDFVGIKVSREGEPVPKVFQMAKFYIKIGIELSGY